MENTLLLLGGLIIPFIVGLFTSRNTSKEAGKVLDLSQKIKDNQAKSAQAQKTADDAVKEYQDALKKYDPGFHNDDDGGGKPSA